MNFLSNISVFWAGECNEFRPHFKKFATKNFEGVTLAKETALGRIVQI